MSKKLAHLLIVIVMVLAACNNENKNQTTSSSVKAEKVESLSESRKFVSSIEKAHNKEVFGSKEAIQFDLALNFGGKKLFDGTVTMTPSLDKIRMQDSTATMIWDGKKAMIAPDTSNEMGARYTLFTWTYFFAASYKFSDPGTHHELLGEQTLNNKSYIASKLTFDEGVGDTPDDWYIVYRQDSSHLLAAMAYIMTANGTSQEKAEEDPHAITYEAYTEVEGVSFATVWNFWNWNKDGQMDKLLGNASIANIKFVKIDENAFKVTGEEKPVM